MLFRSHGTYTIGPTVWKATAAAAEVEEIAMITHFAMLHGQPIVLTREQVEEYQNIYATLFGQEEKA